MNQEQLETEIRHHMNTDFIEKEQLLIVESILDEMIGRIDNVFGDNDGEPLDEDGIKFITKLLELKWKLSNAVYEDDDN